MIIPRRLPAVCQSVSCLRRRRFLERKLYYAVWHCQSSRRGNDLEAPERKRGTCDSTPRDQLQRRVATTPARSLAAEVSRDCARIEWLLRRRLIAQSRHGRHAGSVVHAYTLQRKQQAESNHRVDIDRLAPVGLLSSKNYRCR